MILLSTTRKSDKPHNNHNKPCPNDKLPRPHKVLIDAPQMHGWGKEQSDSDEDMMKEKIRTVVHITIIKHIFKQKKNMTHHFFLNTKLSP